MFSMRNQPWFFDQPGPGLEGLVASDSITNEPNAQPSSRCFAINIMAPGSRIRHGSSAAISAGFGGGAAPLDAGGSKRSSLREKFVRTFVCVIFFVSAWYAADKTTVPAPD